MQRIKFDFIMTTVIIILIGIGFSMIFSTSSVIGLERNQMSYFVQRHTVYVLIGIMFVFIIAKIPYQKLVSMPILIYLLNGITLLLMIMVIFTPFGVEVNGAKRWLEIGPLNFQPSEMVKMTIIVTLSYFIYKQKKEEVFDDFKKGFIPILLLIGIYVFFVIMQRHLSATGLIVIVSSAILLVSGWRKAFFAIFMSLGVVLAFLGVLLQPYRMKRFMSFLGDNKDVLGDDYQLTQSYYALGSGEWFGLGLGMSRQKFGWLPENHTDFILAIIGEEAGFIGILMIIILFLTFALRGYWIAAHAKDLTGLLLCFGVVFLIFTQTILNMLVISGWFPVTGVPVPFLSYGGTSTIVMFVGLGIIYNVYSQIKTD